MKKKTGPPPKTPLVPSETQTLEITDVTPLAPYEPVKGRGMLLEYLFNKVRSVSGAKWIEVEWRVYSEYVAKHMDTYLQMLGLRGK